MEFNKEEVDKYIAGVDPYNDRDKPSMYFMDELGTLARQYAQSEQRTRQGFLELIRKHAKEQGTLLVNSSPKYYQIVKNETELQKFIDFLPDLEPEQKFYYSLFARKKYGATEGLKSDKCQLKRGTTTKERMLRDFKKLEVAVGLYELGGLEINQDSLVLYISPNPSDMHRAALKTAKQIVSDMVDGRRLKSPNAMALNEIQTNVVKNYFNIDVDLTDTGMSFDRATSMTILRDMKCVNEEAMTFIATRGGFHVLVEYSKINKEYQNKWYRNFSTAKHDFFEIDMNNGSGMIPIPGCVQSNFTPYLR